MTIRNTLTSIALIGTLALGSIRCGKSYFQYQYDDKIGGDQVTFTETIFPSRNNMLTVTKSDGRIIMYVDNVGNDLKLEYVTVTKNDSLILFAKNDEIKLIIKKPVLEEAQKQFDEYLQKILEEKQRIFKEKQSKDLNEIRKK